jgi:hypothetical protein
MAIPVNDFVTKPFNDDAMYYDLDLHQYVLELDYAMFQTGLGDLVVDVSGLDNAKWLLEWISRAVYTYIRSFKDSKFEKRISYYLSHSKQSREAIKRLMLDVLFYTEQEGGLFMTYITGINLQEGKNMTTLSLKTAVGIMGDQIAKNYGLTEREFRYDFVIEQDTYGIFW